MVKDRKVVWFNKKDFRLYEKLKAKGIITQEFPEFVKGAFHDKILLMRKEAKKIKE